MTEVAIATVIHSPAAKRALSWLHIAGVMFSWGGLFFIVVSLLPAQAVLAPDDWNRLMTATLSFFLPIHWTFVPIAISAGILKIFEHLTKVQDLGPALGTLYGKTVLTKMLVGSVFLSNALLITGTLSGHLPLGSVLLALLYLQVVLGFVMIGFGVTLRNMG